MNNMTGFFSLNPELFKVVSIYDDAAARERAMQVCDHLVSLLWEDAELKFHWWRTHFLRDAGLARMAAQNAVEADFVILSSNNSSMVSEELEAWFESWIDLRNTKDGALVNLVASPGPGTESTYREDYLREISQRAKLDLLTVINDGNQTFVDVSVAQSRPLSQIFSSHTHFGLNE